MEKEKEPDYRKEVKNIKITLRLYMALTDSLIKGEAMLRESVEELKAGNGNAHK